MPCFTFKVYKFYFTKQSDIDFTAVYSIRFQKTNTPAAGTGVLCLCNSEGSVLVSYSATNKYQGENWNIGLFWLQDHQVQSFT